MHSVLRFPCVVWGVETVRIQENGLMKMKKTQPTQKNMQELAYLKKCQGNIDELMETCQAVGEDPEETHAFTSRVLQRRGKTCDKSPDLMKQMETSREKHRERAPGEIRNGSTVKGETRRPEEME